MVSTERYLDGLHLPEHALLLLQDDIAHVVVMPNVTLSKLEGFVADLIASRARAATHAALRIAADARAICDDELRGGSDDDC